MQRLLTAAGALVALAVPAAATASPAALPAITRTLTAKAAVQRDCAAAPDALRRGLARLRYLAPMGGYVTARLAGRSTSDWDLVAIDRASGRRLAASQAFGSDELVQTWTRAGQRIDFVACRRSGSARRARLRISFFDVRPPSVPAIVKLVRVHGSTAELRALERTGLDVTESRGAGWADVLVSGARDAALLAKSGLRHTTRVADVDAYAARSRSADARYAARVGAAGSPLPSGRTTYRSYEEMQADLKALAEQHPDLVRPVTIGKSFQGREIQGVEIAKDVNGDDGRPTFFLMGTHHAREWPSEEIAMEYATMLATQGGSDPRVANLLARERTLVVPVVNVDGFVSTHTFGDIDPATQTNDPNVELVEAVAPPGGILALRRKNCDGAVPDPSFPCELQWGIDNNRNYGNLWGGPGSSQDPTSQSYHGPAPRSEPETQAVWNYTRTHQVTGLMSLHTIAALVLRPPGLHDAGLAPDEAAMKDLGDRMAAATGYTSQYSWQLYDTAGTTEDDTYAATGGYGYTIEIGPAGGVFHGPYEDAVVKQWQQGDSKDGGGMREALLLMGEEVADPAHHAVIHGSAPAGAKLTLSKSFDTLTSKWCDMGIDPVVTVTTVPEPLACPQGVQDPITLHDKLESSTVVPAGGTFEWHVNQSTRPFVGGGAIIRELSDTPSREETFTGGGPDPQNNAPAQSSQDREYTIGPDEHPDVVKIDVTWDTPEDYDLEVYRKNADGSLTQIGSSGNEPGFPESTQLSGSQVTPGTYVVRVVNFAAAVGTWTAKVGLYSATETVTTGHPEAYTLTCEVGGTVVASREVYIARGESLDLDACSGDAPAVVHPSADGAPVAGPPGTAAQSGSKKATSRAARLRAAARKATRRCARARRAARRAHGERAKARAHRRARRQCAKARHLRAKARRHRHGAKRQHRS